MSLLATVFLPSCFLSLWTDSFVNINLIIWQFGFSVLVECDSEKGTFSKLMRTDLTSGDLVLFLYLCRATLGGTDTHS